LKTAAIYGRVSSAKQKEEQTIGSQITALKEYAAKQGYSVPPEWIFKDEGYSGAMLQRPGLEEMRDLAAEGQITNILIYSPDRLSRKYAYQVLLIEEFSRYGVEVVFIKSPQATTPEEHLLVQFQGMFAEYERAQIAERCRRGKKHRAKTGSVNVLSNAPYGYRYVKKNESAGAYYEVMEQEAKSVQKTFRLFTKELKSIGEITRILTSECIPTRFGKKVWERSTVWAMLRNPAYKGTACYGKTKKADRQKVTRKLRQRGGFSPRNSCSQERPKEEWIEIPVPALIEESTFQLAQERLEKNKQFSKRRTIEPTLLQGLLVCSECGYTVYRTSTRTSKRKIYYYRCLGSDKYRHQGRRVCNNRPMRQDYLDALVWDQVLNMIKDPKIIHQEITRRIKESKASNPTIKRKEAIIKENVRVRKGINRLIDGFQEGIIELSELRIRTTDLRKREKTLHGELKALEAALVGKTTYLKLVNKVDNFMDQINKSEESMPIEDRQRVLRLIVKEILVGPQTLTIKHSIPFADSTDIENGKNNNALISNGSAEHASLESKSYLLCGRSRFADPGKCVSALSATGRPLNHLLPSDTNRNRLRLFFYINDLIVFPCKTS